MHRTLVCRAGLSILSLLGGCAPAIKEAYACDLVQKGDCTLRPSAMYTIPEDPRLAASLKTWTDFSHHLYFHSRITPGLRLEIQGMGKKEQQKLEDASCEWTLEDPLQKLRPVQGRMEGMRVDENGLWCFDYLGTMLLALVRENKISEQPAHLPGLFPLRLRITAHTGPDQAVHPEPGKGSERSTQSPADGEYSRSIERSVDLHLPDASILR